MTEIVRAEFEDIEVFEKLRKLQIQVENNTICDDCPFRDYCENYPYDCDALDALKKLFGKEAKP
jgi:MoaA/NifB/PqqE/SkfB family radical SAM enzyme